MTLYMNGMSATSVEGDAVNDSCERRLTNDANNLMGRCLSEILDNALECLHLGTYVEFMKRSRSRRNRERYFMCKLSRSMKAYSLV